MISTKYQLDETGFKRKKNLETLPDIPELKIFKNNVQLI